MSEMRSTDYEPRERKKHTSRRVKKLDVESLPVAPASTETNLPAERHESPALAPVVLETVQALEVTKSSRRHSQHCIPLVPLSPPRVSAACSLILSPEDHSAIHHFRTTFSTNQHTKNPQFSVLSIIFHLAAESPMLMHMVVALAGREATYFKFEDDENGRELESSITHYTLAMQAIAKAIDGTDASDLGIVLAALWLMIIYEQKYGDSDGLANHLKGAASILRQRCRTLVDGSFTSKELSLSEEKEYNDERSKIAAMFAARMLVWLSAVDAGAASYGIGGHVNSSIVELIACCAQRNNASPLKGFSVIHRHSRPLFRMMWGEAYPQSELLDDLQNQEVYSLFGECFQLRFMVARLASLSHEDPAAAETRSKSVVQTLQQVGEKYSELLASSELLRFEDNSGQRLVSNILSIVPHYYAAILEFFRVVRPGKPLNERQLHGLSRLQTRW